MRRFLPPGTELRIGIWVRGPEKMQLIVVHGKVMRASALDDGALIGAQFVTPLTPSAQPLLCRALDRKLSA